MTALLPFELTDSQREAVARIGVDLASTVPMQRLLQGDVGSGKTVVALIALLQVVAAGHQGAFVAPTEVLAEQHAASLRSLLAPLGERAPDVRLLTGSPPPAARREIVAALASAHPLIVVGTHALFQDGVRVPGLGLVVVDEQHRFGVEQRSALSGAREDGRAVHELVMTATPIPRTIAMTVFGGLDDTRMVGKPKDRSPVATYLADATNGAWVRRAWQRAAEEIAQGRRVYVVCPRIDASDDVADAEEEAERTRSRANDEATALVSQARSDAEATIADANAQAARIISTENIVRMAEDRAREIVSEAKRSAASLREGADDYVASSLDELAHLISDLARRTDAGRRTIAERRGVDVTDVDLTNE